MSKTAEIPLKLKGMGQTRRRDTWWIQPLAVFCGLSAFIVYSTWAAFQGDFYSWGPYLSPFYSPEIFGSSPHSLFGARPDWWPSALPFSPAFLILWAPAGFRLTCYYYRGAYYKAFWADPPSCAVSEPRSRYRGEQSFPLIMQNIHRYFMYVAIAIIGFLGYDAWVGFWFPNDAGGSDFGIGVGSIVLLLNVVFLGAYTFSCHSLRHIAGGSLNLLSKAPVRHAAYQCVSCLNRKHMLYAWISLVWVGFTDAYIRLVAMGVWTDVRIF
ncbi:MAG: succinate dehydrogenase [candidate division Zixibacteria bacterium]|nr:succinate dehydrogenase [candidate division Zixibacteria bacterium]